MKDHPNSNHGKSEKQNGRGTIWHLAPIFSGWLDRLQPTQELVLLITALLTGAGAGLSAVILHKLIEWLTSVSFEFLPRISGLDVKWYILLMPAIGGLALGILLLYTTKEAAGHGVTEVMEAIALRGGRMAPIVAPVKLIASVITLGSGGSAGPEGPIVQIGSSIGSTLGQVLHLSDDRIRNLVACGAAGGIAAIFNAPIAGVMFALEIILGELSVAYVGTVVIAAVTASSVSRGLLGAQAIFAVPQAYALETNWEYIFYALLGVVSALVAVVHVKSLYWFEDFFHHLKQMPVWIKPAIGGLLLGVMAFAIKMVLPALVSDPVPQIYGTGYSWIMNTLNGMPNTTNVFMILLGLTFLKLLSVNLTLGSGGSGGVFAPSLFIGAMLGGAMGSLVNQIFPALSGPVGAFALVGMAAMLAGSAHSPITAVMLVFELTGDYRIILPLMLSVVVATLLARSWLGNESIYTLKLARSGERLSSGRDVDILQSVTVAEIMTRETDTVTTGMNIVELSEAFSTLQHHGFPVVDKHGKLAGVVTIKDLEKAIAQNKSRRTDVMEVATPRARLLVAYPDEAMGTVLARMGTRGLGRLPVVSRESPDKLVGLVRRDDVIRAYNIALTRRAELQHRTKRMKLRDIDGTEFIEVPLEGNDQAIGKTVRQLADGIPDECVLVSVRREGIMIIPHGDTVFQPGDRITAFIRSRDIEALFECMKGTPPI